MTGRTRCRILCLVVLFLEADGFVHGRAEKAEQVGATPTAKEMLHRLWSAARERADVVRASRSEAEGVGQSYVPSNAESFGLMLDYMKDKVTNPPLLSVEQNLLQLQHGVRTLANELIAVRILLTHLMETDQTDFDQSDLKRILSTRLIPVQGPRYTIFPKNDTKSDKL